MSYCIYTCVFVALAQEMDDFRNSNLTYVDGWIVVWTLFVNMWGRWPRLAHTEKGPVVPDSSICLTRRANQDEQPVGEHTP